MVTSLGSSRQALASSTNGDSRANYETLVANNNTSQSEENRRLRFGGVERLFTTSTNDTPWPVLDRLKAATVTVVGMGGVGSWAAEALCRSGVGGLILVDLDDICISNTNRQLHTLSSTVGEMKIDAMRHRLLQINPDCNVTLIHDFVLPHNVHDLLLTYQPTAVLDAMDGSKEKAALLAACTDFSIPVVTCGGSAGKRDPTQIRCVDITRVRGDKLLSSCRNLMRKSYGFTEGLPFHVQRTAGVKQIRKWRIDAVYSTERQKSLPKGTIDAASFRRCDGALGTACFVTGTCGFAAAARIVDMIVEDNLRPPKR